MTDLDDLRKQMARITASIDKMTGERKSVSFGEFATQYLTEKLNNPTLRAGTKKCFELHTRRHLVPAFGGIEIDQITNAVWLRWVSGTRDTARGNRPGLTRFFNTRKTLVEILGAAKERGLLEKLPKLDLPDEKRNVGRAMEQSEIIRILRKCRRPFRLIFYAFWKMGCRPKEILSWEWTMIEQKGDGAWIHVPARISKTDRTRSIPMNPDLAGYLSARFKRGVKSRFVFPCRWHDIPQASYQSAWKRACDLAKVKALPYDLRRTWVSVKAGEGQPLLYMAKYIDSSVKMLGSIYAKSNTDIFEKIAK